MSFLRKIILFLLSFGMSIVVCGQIILTGLVSTAGNKPLAFISVVLLEDTSFVTATITDEDGRFSFSASLHKGTAYTLALSGVGYAPLKQSFTYPDTSILDHIKMEVEGKTLEEVRVTRRAPLVTRRVDRYVVAVENSFLATGHSALDVLQKSPGIWVDNRGGIRIKGNQPVMVMINDVVQQLSGEELADFLRSLRSEDISRIEVISNPPAEFEAAGAGGIIHIILKRGRRSGWTGSANAQYRQQVMQPYATAGATINYGMERFNLSTSYGYTVDRRTIAEEAVIAHGDSRYTGVADRREHIRRNQYRLGVVYDVTKNQTFSLQTTLTGSRFQQNFRTNEVYSKLGTDIVAIAYTDKRRLFRFGSTTLNYAWKIDTAGSILRFIADYTFNKKDERNLFEEISLDPSHTSTNRNNNPVSTKIATMQADYSVPLRRKALLKAGLKFASIKRNNQLQTEDSTASGWVRNLSNTSGFIYDEKGFMGYTALEISRKCFEMKIGLRAEQTISGGDATPSRLKLTKSYFGLFPSIFLLHPVNANTGTALTLSYTKRVTRPSLSDLNPARVPFSNYTALRGNPDLRPQFAHTITAGWRFRRNYSIEGHVTRTLNYIALSALRNSDNVIEYLSENVGNTTEWGIDMNGSSQLLKVWNVNNNVSFFRSGYIYRTIMYQQSSFSIKSVHTVALPRNFDLDVVADYRSPYIYTNLYTYGSFSMDVGLTKKLLKDKARLRLAFTDIFNTLKERELTEEEDTYIWFYRKRPTRTAAIYFTYNFSSGKKITARRIDGGSGEEKGRIGN